MFFKKEAPIVKWGILGGLAEAIYCGLVAIFMNFAPQFLPKSSSNILTAMMFLMLLVFSAALSGLFVFGYPLYLALQKDYRGAVKTAAISIITILAALIIAVFVIYTFK